VALKYGKQIRINEAILYAEVAGSNAARCDYICRVLKVESFQSALILRTNSKKKQERMAIPLAKCIDGGREERV
jgi:hypothetical protein